VIHHVDFAVADFERSREFYRRALEPLGLGLVMEIRRDDHGMLAGFGRPPDPEFWIRGGRPVAEWLHVAFRAETREAVDAFHRAALAAGGGGTDNGAPGERPRYAEHYYAAYVLDPDGHNVEAVCRERA
jgi:catechol 2,3-dioxygenase-like lactoylglutathione lyase family enzyme